jgi:hypothetical protein
MVVEAAGGEGWAAAALGLCIMTRSAGRWIGEWGSWGKVEGVVVERDDLEEADLREALRWKRKRPDCICGEGRGGEGKGRNVRLLPGKVPTYLY